MIKQETQTPNWLPVWTLYPKRAELRIGIHRLLLASARLWKIGSEGSPLWECKVLGVILAGRPKEVDGAISLIEYVLSLPSCPIQSSPEMEAEYSRLELELKEAKLQIESLRKQHIGLLQAQVRKNMQESNQ